jgi:hypothetical protein
MASAADSVLRMQAFMVAREKLERILASNSVKEMIEYGTSEKYPDIEWETTVETFYESVTSKMWVRAVCLAEYIDAEGENQTVELTHWLTDLNEQQIQELMKQEQLSPEQILETIQQAAEYAGVDVDTIQQWIDNGMLLTEDGFFIKNELDLYKQTDGNPTEEDRRRQRQKEKGLLDDQSEPSDFNMPSDPMISIDEFLKER